MRSVRGVVAAWVCLLAVPAALLVQRLLGGGAEIVLHLVLGAGGLLTAAAVFDFAPIRWLNMFGALAIGAVGGIFVLQGVSLLLHNAALAQLAFAVLGQQLETWLIDLFLVWCLATVLLASQGTTRLFGLGVMALVIGAEVVSHTVRYLAAASGGPPAWLKLTLLLPFVWLLVLSWQKQQPAGAPARTVASPAPGMGKP